MPSLDFDPAISHLPLNITRKTGNAECLKEPQELSHAGKNDSQLREACREMESMFVYYLFKEMRATIPKSGLVGEGKTEEIYTSLLDLELSKELSSKGGLGLSSILFDQLCRNSGKKLER